ncbi:MAG: Uncharacterized protein AWT59_3458 [Candidatus Gallionella acididurans]|uniref:ParB-related ThiF-related cassette protein E domain-containing protein n=1 Tax=Candidatus Gallionella acididurans TaxID=1796491 RepID=A0A139BNA2_9PROT|nr:MAG: Uncharacterized protein AWT59_3458 [Candidatus Gallionella acididurans]
MFKALQPLLAGLTSLTVSLVANADDTITVTVTPKGGKTGSTIDTPLSLTATAAELDEGFAEVLLGYTGKRQNLSDQLAATEAILEAAQKEATEKAKKSIAKPAKNSSSDNLDDEPDGSDDEPDACVTAPDSSAPSSTLSTSTPAVSSDTKGLWE